MNRSIKPLYELVVSGAIYEEYYRKKSREEVVGLIADAWEYLESVGARDDLRQHISIRSKDGDGGKPIPPLPGQKELFE